MDQELLRELVMNYGEFLEAEDWSEKAVRAVFADDAAVEFVVGGTGTGISEISDKHEKMMTLFTGAHHNITNVVFEQLEESYAKIRFHMEVIHEVKPEIAEKKPGNLFIANDRIYTEAKREGSAWKFSTLKMETVYKRIVSGM